MSRCKLVGSALLKQPDPWPNPDRRSDVVERSESVPLGTTADHGECIEWTGWRDPDGYGSAYTGKVNGRNKYVLAHRLAWSDANGSIPAGLCVLHRCDNPPCVNLDHLFLGTVAENNRDRALKGRNSDRRGERHHLARLTDATIAEIRQLHSQGGVTQRQIADRFNLSNQYVSRIVTRKARVEAVHHKAT